MKEFRAIVVGGGPAGAATAIALARAGDPVLLLERSHYDDWRAGEILPPFARVPLAELGVWDRFSADGHLPSHAIHSAWGSADLFETDFIFNPYGKGWHLDRRRFNTLLACHAGNMGALVLQDARLAGATRADDYWEAQVEGAEPFAARAEWLVDATGRVSRVAVSQGASRLNYDRLTGMVATFAPESPAVATESVLLLEATEEGWWYSAPLPDGTLLVAYMTDLDYIARSGMRRSVFYEVKLGRSRNTLERTQGYVRMGEIRIRAAGTGRLQKAAGTGWIAVGDAAGTYDPLSADGITKALDQGLRVAAAIRNPVDGPAEYARYVAESFADYLRLRTEYYRREMRWAGSHFWRRRHAEAS